MDNKSGLWTGIGFALVILAIFLGFGSCIKLSDPDGNNFKIEQEKTKQLEIQLKIEELKKVV